MMCVGLSSKFTYKERDYSYLARSLGNIPYPESRFLGLLS